MDEIESRPPRKRWPMALAAAALVALAAWLAWPEKPQAVPPSGESKPEPPREGFYSQVTIEIQPDATVKDVETFARTQIEVLTSDEVLVRVVERLDLVKKLSPPGTSMPPAWVIKTLKSDMIVRQVPGTMLIAVGVFSKDQHVASDIANLVFIVYRDIRIEQVRRLIPTLPDDRLIEVARAWERAIPNMPQTKIPKLVPPTPTPPPGSQPDNRIAYIALACLALGGAISLRIFVTRRR